MLHLYVIFNVINSYLRNLFQKKESGLRSDVKYFQPTYYNNIRFTQALRFVVLGVLFVLSAGVVRGQCDGPASTVVDTIKPMTVCSGGELQFSVGYDSENDSIVLRSGEPHVDSAKRMFIPQSNSGEYPCDDGGGCAIYSDTITFLGYNHIISDSNDIKYVRLNIEHGSASELNIRLVCPSGARKNILNALEEPSSDESNCYDPNNVGWNCDNNDCLDYGIEASFGEGNTIGSQYYPCDSTNTYNAPQTGWNYCWSNNSSAISVEQYAGFIYNNIIYDDPDVGPFYFDSTNLVEFTHFYHPDQSFQGFEGCQIDGPWVIEIFDYMGLQGMVENTGFNGYLFDWEIVFADELAGGGSGGGNTWTTQRC